MILFVFEKNGADYQIDWHHQLQNLQILNLFWVPPWIWSALFREMKADTSQVMARYCTSKNLISVFSLVVSVLRHDVDGSVSVQHFWRGNSQQFTQVSISECEKGVLTGGFVCFTWYSCYKSCRSASSFRCSRKTKSNLICLVSFYFLGSTT